MRQRCQQVQIALDQCILGDQRERVASLGQYFDDAPGQLQAPFGRLVGIGIDSQRDRADLVARPRQLAPQYFRRIGLGEDLGLEVQARRQVQIGMRWTGETVAAAAFYGKFDFCSLAQTSKGRDYGASLGQSAQDWPGIRQG